jgi:uncharacterized lipoprotein YbaY
MPRSKTAGAMLLVALFGCPSGDANKTRSEDMNPPTEAKSMGVLHVEVFYRETIMLPPTATLEVMLEDTAKMDALLPRESAATVS